jgi:acyl-CoA synthetase (AMP-forming)/AMP-acid ligase II
VTAGYFRNPEATASALHDGWMDSGDLGYWAEGELVVTGRQKDLIIKAGRNLYPQEVEELVGDVPGIRKGAWPRSAWPTPRSGRNAWWWSPRAGRRSPRPGSVSGPPSPTGWRRRWGCPDVAVISDPGSVP